MLGYDDEYNNKKVCFLNHAVEETKEIWTKNLHKAIYKLNTTLIWILNVILLNRYVKKHCTF